MFRNRLPHFRVLSVALSAMAWLLPTTPAFCEEPETAVVALLFGAEEGAPECLDDPVGIVFGVGQDSNSTTITLSSVFGEPFGNENLVRTNAMYVSRDGGRHNVWGFSSALPPGSGFMGLGTKSTATVLYCGFVSNNSGTIEPDDYGSALLVIVSGSVR